MSPPNSNRLTRVLVTGAGGFVGGHLAAYLRSKGYWVRGVDIKTPEYRSVAEFDEFRELDLRHRHNCIEATSDIEEVYGLAANMGGMGFIHYHKAEIVRDNALINLHTIESARLNGVKRYFYTSSACAYPGYRQNELHSKPLREEDAYPADPEDGYGWEKLYMERVCLHYKEDYNFDSMNFLSVMA